MVKHWTERSPYAVARALMDQHGMEYDQAFRFAWYTMRKGHPTASLDQILSRIMKVKNIPMVSEISFQIMQTNLQYVLGEACYEYSYYDRRFLRYLLQLDVV